MKTTKWVEFSKEVEIEFDGNDALAAIMGDTEGYTPEQILKRVINNTCTTIRAMSTEVIAGLTPYTRQLIRSFCL